MIDNFITLLLMGSLFAVTVNGQQTKGPKATDIVQLFKLVSFFDFFLLMIFSFYFITGYI